MKHLLTISLALISISIQAQDVAEMDRRNGFKDIKLGTHIDTVAGAVFKKDFKERNEFPAKMYQVDNDNLKSIGEVKVKKVEVRTYKDLIYEIIVITDKDTRLMKGMQKSFGKPTYIIPTDTYNWKSEKIALTFKDHSKSEIKLTWRYYPVIKMMLADKGKKIDEIADDF